MKQVIGLLIGLSFLSFADSSVGQALQHLANNTALEAVASTSYTTVVRDGFATPGDSPSLVFTSSSSACSLNAGMGDGGSQVPTSDSKCWLANFPSSGAALSQWGADPTGGTDSTTKVQAAVTALNGKNIPLLVDGVYKVGAPGGIPGTGIVVPAGVTFAATNYQPYSPTAGPRFVCNNQAAYICVSMGTGGGGSFSMSGVSIVGSGATPASGAIGLEWNGGYANWANNVKVAGFDTCIKWLSGAVNGINFTGNHVNAAACQSHYLVFDGWPEAHLYATRLGDQSGDFNATDAIRFQNTSGTGAGSGPNTIDFDQLQFNNGNGDYANCIVSFGGYTAGGGFQGEFRFTNSHMEEHNTGGTAVICTDATVPALQQFYLTNNVFSIGSGVPLFALNAKTALIQDYFSGNTFAGCTGATLAPAPTSGPSFDAVSFTNNFGCDSLSVTSNGMGNNTLNLTGNVWYNESIAGNWDGNLSFSDGPVAGLTNLASGNVSILRGGNFALSGSSSPTAQVSQSSSSTSAPATIGFTNSAAGNASALILDSVNALRSANGDRVQANSYWGMEVHGAMVSGTSPSFTAGSTTDPSLSVFGGSGNVGPAFQVLNNAGTSTWMTVAGSGNVGIGTTSPTHTLEVHGTAAGTSGWTVISDERLKRDILPVLDGLSIVDQLRPVRYQWRRSADRSVGRDLDLPDGEPQIGFIGQDLARVAPEAAVVPETADGVYWIKEDNLIPVLVSAVKAQQREIEALENRVRGLEATAR